MFSLSIQLFLFQSISLFELASNQMKHDYIDCCSDCLCFLSLSLSFGSIILCQYYSVWLIEHYCL